jgi:hypothetical protein
MVTPDIRRILRSPPPGEAERYSHLHDDLRTFVTHAHDTPLQLKLLTHGPVEGVWEIRSYEEEPQMRLLGHFSARNEFIGLVVRYRDELAGTTCNADMRLVASRWRELFSGHTPKTTTRVNELFFGATHGDEYYQEGRD